MKKILTVCFALLFVCSLQSAEVPFIKPTVELKGIEEIYFASFSPDGKRIIIYCGEGTAHTWDAETGKKLEESGSVFSDAIISPDGKRFATIDIQEDKDFFPVAICVIWDATTKKELRKLIPDEPHCCLYFIHFSADNTRLVTEYCGTVARLWNVNSGEKLQTMEGISFVGFTPDGTKVVTVCRYDGYIQIWNAITGKLLFGEQPQNQDDDSQREVRSEDLSFSSAILSPDGKRIVMVTHKIGGNRMDAVRIFDVNSGKELQQLQGHSLVFWSAALSPDGKQVITASLDGTVRIWDAETGKEQQTLEGRPVDSIPNGQRSIAVTTGGLVSFVAVDAAGEWYEPWGEYIGNEPHFAEFSSDGKKIITKNYKEEIIRIFDAGSGKELHQWKGKLLAFSPDRKKIITADSDNVVRVWTLP